MKTNKKTTLNCEQVYEIWKSEPELISIVDIREISEYTNYHIPGSVHLEYAQLINHLRTAGSTLVVIVTLESERTIVEKHLDVFENFVIMRDFNHWAKLSIK